MATKKRTPEQKAKDAAAHRAKRAAKRVDATQAHDAAVTAMAKAQAAAKPTPEPHQPSPVATAAAQLAVAFAPTKAAHASALDAYAKTTGLPTATKRNSPRKTAHNTPKNDPWAVQRRALEAKLLAMDPQAAADPVHARMRAQSRAYLEVQRVQKTTVAGAGGATPKCIHVACWNKALANPTIGSACTLAKVAAK